MIKGIRKTTEDTIIEILADGGKTAKSIHRLLRKDKSITKQSLYEQLRKLISEKIILKISKNYFLNIEWIQSVKGLFNSFDAPVLKEGEFISYSFNDIYQLDAYWRHLCYLYNSLDKRIPVFSYDIHPFWEHLYTSLENEKKYEQMFKKDQQTVFFLIGGSTKHDFDFKKRNGTQHYRINCIEGSSLRESDFVMVFADIIITSRFSQGFINKLKHIYDSADSFTELQKQIHVVVSNLKSATLKVERNIQKAKKIQKIILKDFVVSQSLKGRLDL